MSIIQGNAHTSAGGGGFQIERSLRFNSADSAYLNRTLGTSNRRTFTFSTWVKRSLLASNQCIFGNINFAGGGSTNQQFFLGFNGSDQLDLLHYNNGTSNGLTSSAVYRDPSAFYHVVCAIDTTQATSSNRLKLYINGSQITAFASSSYPTQNTDTFINANLATAIGTQVGTGIGNSYYIGGYLTEVNFIDGQALTPSSFGETDSNTGVWKPKAFSGTYGTNGFYLKFADNSGTTSTTLGKDSSGNGNNWTPNNFSVTAGVGNDSLVDSPTSYGTDTGAGGEVRGNYCTFCPTYGATPTLANGNLEATTNNTTAYGSISFTSGKWYWEITVGNANYIGVMDSTYIKTDNNWGSQAVAYVSNGNKYNGTGSAYGASYTTNDVIGVAIDMDAGTIAFYKNGSSQGTAFSSGLAGREFRPLVYSPTSGTQTANFGQRAFAYTAPSGFKALCTQNLPTPTIGATSTTQAGKYFNPVLYSGNSSTQAITGVGFQPDFVWCKARSTAAHGIVTDAVRTAAKVLSPSQTAAESAWADNAFFQSLNSDGFTLTGGGTGINTTGNTYVAWNWKANGAGSSNTAGTITSTVSANTTSGFSIVTYTGNGSANQTVGHGLGVAPAFGILKDRDPNSNNDQWQVFHTGAGDKYGYLSTTAAFAGTAEFYPTSGSSTTVTIARGSPAATTNESGDRYVMYLFAPVAGYSAFGSYTGNNSDDGPFIFTNFRPAFVLIKATNTTQWWTLLDSKRDTYNVSTLGISPNSSDAESTFNTNRGPHNIDFTSNGFKIRTSGSGINGTNTFIYAAFAETPAKFSLAR